MHAHNDPRITERYTNLKSLLHNSAQDELAVHYKNTKKVQMGHIWDTKLNFSLLMKKKDLRFLSKTLNFLMVELEEIAPTTS